MAGDIEEYLKALSHPVRRAVIKLLAERGPLSYSELMKLTHVNDSGTFGFHMRILRGLVRKNEQGDYELTEDGWKLYRALKLLGSEGETTEAAPEAGERRITERKVISDKLIFDLTESLLRKIRSEGGKLFLTDILVLNIHRVPEDLFNETVEGIDDVLVVYSPEELKPIVDLKTGDVLLVTTYKGKPPALGGALNALLSALGTTILSGLSSLRPSAKPTRKLRIEEEVQEDYSLSLEAEGSSAKLEPGEPGRITGEGEGDESSLAEIRVEDSHASLKLVNAKMRIAIPPGLRKGAVKVRRGSLKALLEAPGLEELTAEAEAGSLAINLKKLSTPRISLSASKGSISSTLEYAGTRGEALLEAESSMGSIKLEVKVPRGVAVDAEADSTMGSALIEFGEYRGQSYRDPGYEDADSRLKIRAKSRVGSILVRITRA